jgi:hypothetical protein
MNKTILIILFLISINYLKAQPVYVGVKIFNKANSIIKELSVVEKNTGVGTISSDTGSFLLWLKPGEIVLSFSDGKNDILTTKFVLKSDTIINVYISNLNKLK